MIIVNKVTGFDFVATITFSGTLFIFKNILVIDQSLFSEIMDKSGQTAFNDKLELTTLFTGIS